MAVVTAGFNYWLHTHAPGVLASQPNKFAVIWESSYASYSGIRGDIYTGNPSPVPEGTLSNQTIWAVETGACPGELSFVETGWTKRTSGYVYEFIHRVPSFGCQVRTREIPGAPQPGSVHDYRLEYCTNCGTLKIWYLYIDGQWKSGMTTGWSNADFVEAGGEVAGDYVGIGMQGGVNSLRYRRGATWYYFNYHDGKRCDPGDSLTYNGAPYSIFEWEYAFPSSCPP